MQALATAGIGFSIADAAQDLAALPRPSRARMAARAFMRAAGLPAQGGDTGGGADGGGNGPGRRSLQGTPGGRSPHRARRAELG